MPDHAHEPGPEPGSEPKPEGALHRPEALGLWAYLERQFEELANGPTMADILADMDRYRRADGPTTAEIVEALHEAREERGEHLDRIRQT